MTHFCFLYISISSISGFLVPPSVNQYKLNPNIPFTIFQSSKTTLEKNNEVNSIEDESMRISKKNKLIQLLKSTPNNQATSSYLTKDILQIVRELESYCPTSDKNVLTTLSGNWELVWTAQDISSNEIQNNSFWSTYINPLENQSYSNNPNKQGQSNPILPQEIQQSLEEKFGVQLSTSTKSSQAIDLQKKRVRNVVSVQLPLQPRPSAIIVDVSFKPSQENTRQVNVKFDTCTFQFNSNLKFKLPLGIIGPTGWLRTNYIDDEIRITRGHKGSVFILSRPASKLF